MLHLGSKTIEYAKPLMGMTPPRISLLAFDLDGTLLTSKKRISDRSLAAIKFARMCGTKITICSGRSPSQMRVFLDMLELHGPYVASNGATVINDLSGETLFSKPFSPSAVKRLAKLFDFFGYDFALVTSDVFYHTPGYLRLNLLDSYDELIASQGGKLSVRKTLGFGLSGFEGEDVIKALCLPKNTMMSDRLECLLHDDAEVLCAVSGSGLFDISPAGTDKSDALKVVADYYCIPMENVCAMGDYDNDISMFESVGFGVAMGNSIESLLDVAHYQTDTNDNEGIAKAIEYLSPWLGR